MNYRFDFLPSNRKTLRVRTFMESNLTRTHTFEPTERRTIDIVMDYTIYPAGIPIAGHLSNGIATDSTVRCPKCQRVGVISLEHDGSQIVVHRGSIDGDTLTGIDYCKIDFRA